MRDGLLRLSNGFLWVDHTEEDKSLSVIYWYCFNLDTKKKKKKLQRLEKIHKVQKALWKGAKTEKQHSSVDSTQEWPKHSKSFQGSDFVLLNKIIILWSGVQSTRAKKTWAIKRLSYMPIITHSGSVRGVVSLGSVGPAALWFAVQPCSVLTSTIGSLDSSFL